MRISIKRLWRSLALGALLLLALVAMLPARAFAESPLYKCDNLARNSELSDFGESLYQGGDGWFFRASDFNHLYLLSETSFRFLKRLHDVLQQRGITLVLLPVPPKAVMEPERALESIADQPIVYDPGYAKDQFEAALKTVEDHGIAVVDLLDYMQKKGLPTEDRFFKRDLHWRPELSQIAAQASADVFRTVLKTDSLGDKPYSTKLAQTITYQPVISVLLRQLCHSNVPYEQLPDYHTTPDNEDVGSFLSTEDSAPPIDVVGTSFTDEEPLKFNFAGFLRDATRADVAMYSFAGANVDQSLYRWAYQGLATTKGTRILLWEMPYFDRFEAAVAAMDREIIPAIEGPCSGGPNDAFSATYSLGADGRVEVPVPADKHISGANFYLSATLSDGTQNQFVLSLNYADGQTDIVPIVRPDRVGAVTSMYANLSPEFSADLSSISLRLAPGTKLSGNMTICRAGV